MKDNFTPPKLTNKILLPLRFFAENIEIIPCEYLRDSQILLVDSKTHVHEFQHVINYSKNRDIPDEV